MDHVETAVGVRVVGRYVIEVTFDDGHVRRTDIEPLLWGKVFEPLRDPAYFALVTVDEELGTVVWPNGADLAPEFLYHGDANPYAAYLEQHGEPAAASAATTGTTDPDR